MKTRNSKTSSNRKIIMPGQLRLFRAIILSTMIAIALFSGGCREIAEQFAEPEIPEFPPCRTIDERIYGAFEVVVEATGESVSYEFREDGTLLVEHAAGESEAENCREQSSYAFCDGGIFGRIVSNDCSFTDFSAGDMWYDAAELSEDGETLVFTTSGNSYSRR